MVQAISPKEREVNSHLEQNYNVSLIQHDKFAAIEAK